MHEAAIKTQFRGEISSFSEKYGSDSLYFSGDNPFIMMKDMLSCAGRFMHPEINEKGGKYLNFIISGAKGTLIFEKFPI
jgi:hypothetical protein